MAHGDAKKSRPGYGLRQQRRPARDCSTASVVSDGVFPLSDVLFVII